MNELAPIVLVFRLAVGDGPAEPARFENVVMPSATQPAADRFFAEDKLQHFFMSFATTQLAYGAARAAGVERDAALVGAGAASAAAGLWKEFRDRRAGLPFSGKDLVWDALGTGAGVAVADRVR